MTQLFFDESTVRTLASNHIFVRGEQYSKGGLSVVLPLKVRPTAPSSTENTIT